MTTPRKNAEGYVLIFNGRPVEDAAREPRTWPTAEAAMAYARAQGEPWASGCKVVENTRNNEC